MSKYSNHVVRNHRGGWSVRKEGSDKADRVFHSREAAIRYARELSKHEGSDLVIHSMDGRIKSKDSYSIN